MAVGGRHLNGVSTGILSRPPRTKVTYEHAPKHPKHIHLPPTFRVVWLIGTRAVFNKDVCRSTLTYQVSIFKVTSDLDKASVRVP